MNHMRKAVNATLMQVGIEVFQIFGSDATGWSVEASDFTNPPSASKRLFYANRSELYFALTNFYYSEESSA